MTTLKAIPNELIDFWEQRLAETTQQGLGRASARSRNDQTPKPG